MKGKILLSTLLTATIWSLSSLALADWDAGPCPGGGTAPCIEAEVSGNTYHFNGTGDHAGEWHGLPTTGEDFEFVADHVDWGCGGLNWDCSLSWSAKVKKCQDSNGDWRIGVKVNSTAISGGFACGTFVFGGFPWYTRDSTIANHCPFEDNCDSFILYHPSASHYVSNLGEVDLTVFGIPRITDAHLHGVVFTPGTGATFSFASQFYNCDEEDQGCVISGDLVLNNATSLDIH